MFWVFPQHSGLGIFQYPGYTEIPGLGFYLGCDFNLLPVFYYSDCLGFASNPASFFLLKQET